MCSGNKPRISSATQDNTNVFVSWTQLWYFIMTCKFAALQSVLSKVKVKALMIVLQNTSFMHGHKVADHFKREWRWLVNYAVQSNLIRKKVLYQAWIRSSKYGDSSIWCATKSKTPWLRSLLLLWISID